MIDLGTITDAVLAARRGVPAGRALLVAVTGIDGSGKSYVTARLERRLQSTGINVAAINIDGWLELPARRFDPRRLAEHFYERGIRFAEMFDRLVLPLRDRRSIRLAADLTDATAAETCRPHTYDFRGVDVILLDGIFLLRRDLRGYFDLSAWIDCTFETALERALSRNQEGLPPADIIRDYEAVYSPAQRIHLQQDAPRDAATAVVINDPRLVTAGL